MVPKDGNVPDWIRENPKFMYGKSSGAYNEDSQRITEVINYDYLKQHLATSITNNALHDIAHQKQKGLKKDWTNKVYKMRSQSVAHQIQKRKEEEQAEEKRLSFQKENNATRLSRTIQKNMFKFPKQDSFQRTMDVNLNSQPDIQNKDYNTIDAGFNKVLKTPNSFNSINRVDMTKTNKLPPLSEMGMFSENSKRNHPRRRAGTSMDHHATDPPRGEVYPVGVRTPNDALFDDKEDPFYLGEQKKMLDLEISKRQAQNDQFAISLADTSSDFMPSGKKIVASNAKNGTKLVSTEGEVLEAIHKMRLNQFETRADGSLATEKPYLPMLSSDEKELIMEQYYHSKRKLNNV